MKKKLLVFALVAVIFIFASIFIFQQTNKSYHKSISINDVSDIEIYGAGIKSSKVDETAVKKDIINWLNKATDIRLNKEFAGTTSESGIIVNLKSGKRILILRSGRDFEIQRDDAKLKNISYWANQDDLKKMLDQLAETKIMPGLNVDKLTPLETIANNMF